MSFAIQCCTSCGRLEEGHTGPADRYVCAQCTRQRVAALRETAVRFSADDDQVPAGPTPLKCPMCGTVLEYYVEHGDVMCDECGWYPEGPDEDGDDDGDGAV